VPDSKPIPTLFGRITAASSEHSRLAATLAELRETCLLADDLGRSPGVAPRSPATLLRHLHDTLSRHFAAEESEAYFGALVREYPQAAARVAALREQHPEFLAEVDRLQARALKEDATALAADVSALVARYLAHEQVEEHLMREFLRSAGD
jgi:hypothetical protein